jgi:hypothetical protein
VVLNVVVSAPRQVLGDLRPSVAQFLMSLDDEHIFLLSPLVLLDVRVQVVVPSVLIINKWLPFPALLAYPSREGGGDLTPVHRSVFPHHCHECVVLFISPGSLDHCRIEDFLPPMQALHIGATLEKRCDPLPVFCLK